MQVISRNAWMVALVTAAAALASGCDKANDNRTAGQQVDSAVAKVERKAEQIGEATSSAAKDVSITTEIKAQLARDSQLSAIGINVDTSNGQVTLRGTAPDAASRDRAASLAKSISGVVGVDNQLTLKPAS